MGFKLIGGLFQATELAICLYIDQIDLRRQIHQLLQKLTYLLHISFSFYKEAPSSFLICPCHSPFLFSTGTTTTGYSQRNNTKYFLYSRFGCCDEQPNCLMPLGTKSPSITIEYGQPHGMQNNWILRFK